MELEEGGGVERGFWVSQEAVLGDVRAKRREVSRCVRQMADGFRVMNVFPRRVTGRGYKGAWKWSGDGAGECNPPYE